MTTQLPPVAAPPLASPGLWDEARLASLLADVGEAGLRDILRLFMADLPELTQRFADAAAAGDARSARAVLDVLQDSAAAIGLAALCRLVRRLAEDPLAPGGAELLLHETTRIRFVPALKHAS